MKSICVYTHERMGDHLICYGGIKELAKYNDKIYVSLGVNDNKAFIIQILQTEIMKLFE